MTTRRSLASITAFAATIAGLALMQVAVWGQTPAKTWTPPRTMDGKPDLQGVYANATLTPLERPKNLGAKEFYTEQEFAELMKRILEREPIPLRQPARKGPTSRQFIWL